MFHKIVLLSQRTLSGDPDVAPPEGPEENQRASHQARDLLEEQQEEEQQEEQPSEGASRRVPFSPTRSLTGTNQTLSSWLDPTTPPPAEEEEEFVNGVVDYEDSNEPGSAMGVPSQASGLTPMTPMLLELRWQPPRPPTSYEGFNVYISREGKEEEEEEEEGDDDDSVYLFRPISQITNLSRSALQSVHIDIPDL